MEMVLYGERAERERERGGGEGRKKAIEREGGR